MECHGRPLLEICNVAFPVSSTDSDPASFPLNFKTGRLLPTSARAPSVATNYRESGLVHRPFSATQPSRLEWLFLPHCGPYTREPFQAGAEPDAHTEICGVECSTMSTLVPGDPDRLA
jgi:hypothetical protein